VILIDATREDYEEELRNLKNELREYDRALADKPSIILMTKMDLKDAEMEKRIRAFRRKHRNIMAVSSVAHIGVKELLDRIWSELQELRSA
jgi:GTPase involved in cell partitioning and DNA repair